MKVWTREEDEFIDANLRLSAFSLFKAFQKRFPGTSRTLSSIRHKKQRLERFHQLENITGETTVSSGFDDTTYQTFTKFDTRQWIESLLFTASSFKNNSKIEVVEEEGDRALVLFLSDLHVGKNTTEYDTEEAIARILSIPKKIIEQVDLDNLSEIVVCLMGDIIEGEDVYPTQAAHLQTSSISQMKSAVEAIKDMLTELNDNFDGQIIVHSVPGNHGRISKTANEMSNWDNLIYYILGIAFQSHPKIHVGSNMDEFLHFSVLDKKGMINHRGVRHTGTPAMQVKIAGWGRRGDLDFMAHGHWHTFAISEVAGLINISNGSMCGQDQLSERMAKHNTPKQAFMIVERDIPIQQFGFIQW